MTIRIINGDCREVLATLPDKSVHTVVTSPPYWGLRDYGVEGQIGLETSPDAYVAEMVAVFREVRRVLRDDGTLWLNLGDSYARNPAKGGSGPNGKHDFIPDYGNARRILSESKGSSDGKVGRGDRAPLRVGGDGLKEKDLVGIPWMVAFALRADGWYLRSDVIWAKPNPMPESVTDRPTSSHEHVFLLTKKARYFYDGEAIREPGEMKPQNRFTDGKGPKSEGYAAHRQPTGMTECESRNARNVWTIAPIPFAEAHFATFPPELAERCIKAGTSEKGCCAACGAPWVRLTERDVSLESGSGRSGRQPIGKSDWGGQTESGEYDIRMGPVVTTTTVGWSASCQCDANAVPCTVLDPFAGAFTTAMVADRLQRNSIGIELNPEYIEIARRRLVKDAGIFADFANASW